MHGTRGASHAPRAPARPPGAWLAARPRDPSRLDITLSLIKRRVLLQHLYQRRALDAISSACQHPLYCERCPSTGSCSSSQRPPTHNCDNQLKPPSIRIGCKVPCPSFTQQLLPPRSKTSLISVINRPILRVFPLPVVIALSPDLCISQVSCCEACESSDARKALSIVLLPLNSWHSGRVRVGIL